MYTGASVTCSRRRRRPVSLPYRRSAFVLVLLALAFAAAPAPAQELSGSIVGVVKDAQGAFVPGATITITNKDTNLTRDTTTGAEGTYSMRSEERRVGKEGNERRDR